MKTKTKKMAGRLIAAALVLSAGLMQTSCWEEQHPGSYYTFSGETVADFLSNRDSVFSDFIYCLKTAEIWGEMQVYGDHTCFAPTNAAMANYLVDKFPTRPGITVKDLTKDECDTIAKTHLCSSTFFCKDLQDGAFPSPNLLDRYLTYNTDSTIDMEGNMKVVYKVNKSSVIVERDDTVVNGVVHIVDKVISPSNDFLPDRIKVDPTATLFYEALILTKMSDSLVAYMDETYPTPSYDSLLICFKTTGKTAKQYKTAYETDNVVWPEKRMYKYTAFIPQDTILKEKYNVENIEGLKALAYSIYGDDGAEDDFTSRKNSLNKFISYHLLPEYLTYDQLTNSLEKIVNQHDQYDYFDVEDFYETMMPHSFMRISMPKVDKGHKYINRKGTQKSGNLIPGIKVLEPETDVTGLNGGYYYLSDILKYDDYTRNTVFNTRMRYMCNTMSPDFINSNARGRDREVVDRVVYSFLPGYCKNFKVSDESEFAVRYVDFTFGTYNGDEMTIRGIYDVSLKLPPVPVDGTYEIRMFMNTMASDANVGSDRGVVQVYFKQGDYATSEGWQPCGIPVDLTLAGNDPKIGNYKDSGDELKSDEDLIQANEKALRNRGYMKAPNSYHQSSGDNLRDIVDCLRKILTTEYMYANLDYAIRLRLVLDNPSAVCPLNFIELVPKSIYAGDTPEDRY